MRMVSTRKYTPLERAVLAAVQSRLAGPAAELFQQQVNAVNHIQRVLDWQEIDLYAMRFPRRVCWPDSALFPNQSEFQVAHLTCVADGNTIELDVHAVSGHVFSIESELGLKQHSFAKQIQIESVQILNDPMAARPQGNQGDMKAP